MEFELKNQGSYSFEEESSELDDEVDLQTPTLRRSNRVRRPVERYSLPDFCLAFVLSTINDEPRSVKEEVLTGGKIPRNKGRHCPFRKSQLDSRTFGMAGSTRLWTCYRSKLGYDGCFKDQEYQKSQLSN